MKLKILAGILAVTTLAGCATGGDYAAYAQAIEAQARYNAAAKIASANALREIGKTAGETSKTVAALLDRRKQEFKLQFLQVKRHVHGQALYYQQ